MPTSATIAAAYAIAQDATLAEAATALHERGIRPLLIKGPAVARWLYDDPGERPYDDIDLLVTPSQYAAAGATLADLGFRDTRVDLRPDEQHPNEESAWVRVRDRRVCIELHHKLSLIPVRPDIAWERLIQNSQSIHIAGVNIETPSPAVHLVILALHAAHHGAAVPKPQADLRRAIQRVDADTWRQAGVLAAELGAGGAMREGLRLVDGGLEVAERLGLSDDAPRVVRLRARSAPPTASGIERLVRTPGLVPRLALLVHRLAPTPAFMREWQPLARRGTLGLALAYLWRPFWLLYKLPSGGRAWVAAALPPERRARIPAFLAGARWAFGAWRRCRAQLRRRGLNMVAIPSPPEERAGAENGAERVLKVVRASCLERSLVRQSWHAAHGRPRDVVIGVRGTAAAFEAHAWLDGDQEGTPAFTEIKRLRAPSEGDGRSRPCEQ